MTAAEVNSTFYSIVDDVRDDHIPDPLFSRYINTAAKIVMDEELQPFQNRRADWSIESKQTIIERYPLLIEPVTVAANTGIITRAVLTALYPDSIVRNLVGTIVSTEKPFLRHVLFMEPLNPDLTPRVARWCPHNSWGVWRKNPFRKGDTTEVLYREDNIGIQLDTQESVQTNVTMLREPVYFYWDTATPANNVDLELDGEVALKVIYKAAELAGANIREGSLFQMAKMQTKVGE